MKKILILQCHPNANSFCSALAANYKEAAIQRGNQVQLVQLAQLKFDPILRYGFQGEQPLEQDLLDAQALILWAEHIVWVYPNWWGGPPALLKGFIDRTLLPGFAFKYKAGLGFPEKLLSGRTTEIVLTLDTPPFIYKWLFGAPGLKAMKNGILEFCGLKLKRTQLIGPVRGSNDPVRAKWLQKIKDNVS